jgi:hypothetical protein
MLMGIYPQIIGLEMLSRKALRIWVIRHMVKFLKRNRCLVYIARWDAIAILRLGNLRNMPAKALDRSMKR